MLEIIQTNIKNIKIFTKIISDIEEKNIIDT